ncbi:PALP domain-containing protein [Emydomyces testavorans]|uniref:PALP domain-containing protein n=1 Tax=Emydomyces testavorans TaxID=2070801 RepID=A0AAF0DAV3_9EURO|nr:PALP domain-containing protein [Emydomyces testavorans]
MPFLNHPLYSNPSAKTYQHPPDPSQTPLLIRKFHHSLPSYSVSPLIALPTIANSLGVKALFIKDESSRLDLPSFKILGASWGTFRALVAYLDLSLEATGLDELSSAARAKRIKLFAATDGNHGRAVARMGQLLGLETKIYVPGCLDSYTRDLIAREGCTVIPVDGDYDTAVRTAHAQANTCCANGILIQDTSFGGYSTIPSWIVDGYSTLLDELDAQLQQRFSLHPTHLIVPVGVGSLAHAVVAHYKATQPRASVLAVEPATAPCLYASLTAGTLTPLQTTGTTIMNGLDCGTVSMTAWPVLRAGVDASITVSDLEAHQAVEDLAAQGIRLGPCGAAGLAAIRRVAATNAASVGLGADSVVVVLGTEGARPYQVPCSY